MEERIILSERLEEQLKAVEWAKEEQKRILKEKGERLSKELMEKMTPFILNPKKDFECRECGEYQIVNNFMKIAILSNYGDFSS